ncbi:velvet factor-domain-containing protein [Zopfochytrium polystomum]|nr:velvet factor-domain-containing protein [Zopfochytrium polystomum]
MTAERKTPSIVGSSSPSFYSTTGDLAARPPAPSGSSSSGTVPHLATAPSSQNASPNPAPVGSPPIITNSSSTPPETTPSTPPIPGAQPSPHSTHHVTLVGARTTSCYLLRDLDATEGCFFIFSDLSIRVKGLFRMRFQAFDVRQAAVVAVTWTDPFEVFAPNMFPGMMPSTRLSRVFSDQGVPIHLRTAGT